MSTFGVSTEIVQWLTTGNLLVVAMITPLAAFLQKRFKLKHLFIFGTLCFIIGTLLAIVSPNFTLLLIARMIQGIGTGVGVPIAFCIILEQIPFERVADLETDSPVLHAEETLRAGRNIADSNAVRQMTETAPAIIKNLFEKGMAFTLNSEKEPDVRAFGGQSVKRTFYAAPNTGKQLMETLIDQARYYEVQGFIERMTGGCFPD